MSYSHDLQLDTGGDDPSDFPLGASTIPLYAADTHTHWSTCTSKIGFKIMKNRGEVEIHK